MVFGRASEVKGDSCVIAASVKIDKPCNKSVSSKLGEMFERLCSIDLLVALADADSTGEVVEP